MSSASKAGARRALAGLGSVGRWGWGAAAARFSSAGFGSGRQEGPGPEDSSWLVEEVMKEARESPEYKIAERRQASEGWESKGKPAPSPSATTSSTTSSSPSSAPFNMSDPLELSPTRLISVQEYEGQVLVDIRQHFVAPDSGRILRTKKGISLTVSQWQRLKEAILDVDGRIREVQAGLPPRELPAYTPVRPSDPIPF